MTTAQLPAEINATISQAAITRVPDFFNASLEDALTELLQNARRAGATRVDISASQDHFTVSDDGRGITDPQALLSFGDSHWDEALTGSENPAGMGIYSLARREQVTIQSKTADGPAWLVQLKADNFTGADPAPIRLNPGFPAPHGTSISFKPPTYAQNDIERPVRHFPLPVFLNGSPLSRSPFLERSIHQEEWQGIALGVIRGYHSPYYSRRLNFHGVTAALDALPHISDLKNDWHVLADVRDCPKLRLTLPARKEVVNTPFLQELREAALASIFRAMQACTDPFDLPFQTHRQAAEMGFHLPEARAMLHAWQPRFAEADRYEPHPDPTPAGPDCLIMQLEAPTPDQQVLARAIDGAELAERIREPDTRLEGYEWYDSIPKITGMDITLQDGADTHRLQSLRRSGITRQPNPATRPDAITITLHLEGPAGSDRIDIPTDVALYNDEPDIFIDTSTPIVTKNSTIQPFELAALMEEAYFQPGDDIECDARDTQQQDFNKDAMRIARKVLQSPDDAIRSALRDAIQDGPLYDLPRGMNATIVIRRDGSTISSGTIEVLLHQPEELPEQPADSP